MDELIEDGDALICLRAVEKDSSIASDAGIETGTYRDEAQKLYDKVRTKSSQDGKSISLVVELAMGKVQDVIQRMVCPRSSSSAGWLANGYVDPDV